MLKTLRDTIPNIDLATGIAYGVISGNAVSSWSMDEIFTNGTDTDYEDFLEEVKSQISHALTDTREDLTNCDTECLEIRSESLKKNLCARLKDYSGYKGDSCLEELVDDYIDTIAFDGSETDTLTVFNDVREWIGEHWEGTGNCTRFRYECDGYIIQTCGDGDWFVIKSPYYTMCEECSPCAPNTGYIVNEGGTKSYCLGPDWFDSYNKMNYRCFQIEDDVEVFQEDVK